MLSKCDGIIYSQSNVIEAVKIYFQKKSKKNKIMNGYNSSNNIIARWLWFLKNIIPEKFGGFKNNAEVINE